VAKLAGVPGAVIRRARDHLARLDRFSAAGTSQPDLFAPPGAGTVASDAPDADTSPDSSDASAILGKLGSLDPDAMTPRDALAALYELRKLLDR
jgi:DNA mismatch repair protein MutS